MAETLGSLCDKLTIVKLKQWHSEDAARLKSLAHNEEQLLTEIDAFVAQAVSGEIPVDRLVFAANKIYKQVGNEIGAVTGTFGQVFSQLAQVNCALWHEQEKVYDFEAVAPEQKNTVVKQLALLNLQRNECIDRLDRLFKEAIERSLAATTDQR
jgi:hypothetical protein